MRLTEIVLRNLAPPERGQKTYHDDTLPGFGVRVSQGGAKTFTLMVGRDRQLVSIGRYPIIGLADARQIAKTKLAEHTLGKHRPTRIRMSKALERFFAEKEAKNKASTLVTTKSLINKHFKPLIAKYVDEITTDDIADITDGLLEDELPSAANHVYTAGKTVFRWCVKRKYISHSPAEGLDRPAKLVVRERVLSDDELRTVWRAADQQGGQFGAIVKLLILTGQRRTEIGSLRIEWCSLPSSKGVNLDGAITIPPAPLAVGGEDTDCEVSRGYSVSSRILPDELTAKATGGVPSTQCTITLPSEITKNHRTHSFPIGSIGAILLRGERSGYLFPARGSDGDKPFNGWSKAKAQLDKKIDEIRRSAGGGSTEPIARPPIEPWTLHDLRRTYATNLQRLGIKLEVIEALLNHVSGTRAGIVGVYQRHAYEAEMRDAVMTCDEWFGRTIIGAGNEKDREPS